MISEQAYALMGLTAVVAGLVTVLAYAVLKFGSAARDMRRQLREGGAERAFIAAALQEAIDKLKTQERATAARADASERLSDEIVSSLASGLIVVGLDRTVAIANPAARRSIRTEGEQVGADYRVVLAAAPPLTEAIDECLDTHKPIVRRSIEVRRAGAPPQHFGVTVSPLFDGAGALRGAVCLFSDLTEVVSLEEQLRLKDSLARLGELTAGLAHEFRNGLSTIHGYARLIDRDQLPATFGPYLDGIRQETDDLSAIVTNFLTFARPAALTLGPVDIGAVAARVAADAEAEAAASGGSVAIAGHFGSIDGDEMLLRQALANLVRNAIEACAAASVAPRVVIEGQVDRGARMARIDVQDNGPGIDQAVADRIFRPFFSTKGRGTGLGLALVQKIVVTHNGRITVGTSPAGGASFQVALPLLPLA